jgi:hypothetical protein
MFQGGYLVMIECQGRSQRVGPFNADSLESFMQVIYDKCTLITPPYEVDIWDHVFSSYVKLDDFALLPPGTGAVKLSLVKTQSIQIEAPMSISTQLTETLRVDSRWLIKSSDLEFVGVIGSGAFGMVHKYDQFLRNR